MYLINPINIESIPFVDIYVCIKENKYALRTYEFLERKKLQMAPEKKYGKSKNRRKRGEIYFVYNYMTLNLFGNLEETYEKCAL